MAEYLIYFNDLDSKCLESSILNIEGLRLPLIIFMSKGVELFILGDCFTFVKLEFALGGEGLCLNQMLVLGFGFIKEFFLKNKFLESNIKNKLKKISLFPDFL